MLNIKVKIPKTKNYAVTFVDSEFSFLKEYDWYIGATGGYAMSYINGKHVYLHHLILGKKSGYDTDHINEDKLDNRKENLRFCTRGQNMQNCFMKHNTSGYKGVCKSRTLGKWRSYIKVNGKQIHLGTFESKEEAAEVYNKAAVKYFGKKAWQNQI